MPTSGIILAGGKNSRMGANKALLTLGNRTFIQDAVQNLRQFCAEIIVVSNEPELYRDLGVKVTEDIIPKKGPLSGIHAGLTVSANFHNFIVACDMPFLNWTLGKYMVDNVDGLDVLIPRIGEYLQPLHAVYSKNCIRPIEKCLEQNIFKAQNIFKVIAFYPEVKVGYLDEDKIRELVDVDKVFFNVNTPEDLDRAKAIKNITERMG
ncbi:MAG: molybdenum cofactor guanylyltransferase [Clostridia bacterium]|nr:molybdenum cofactor guanylyltransferase [Clostridia bacterium]